VGHPEAVDCLLAVDEETLATGSSDGFIRIITVQPHKFLCVLGKHEDLPVEKLCLSEDRELLASCSHDCTVRFLSPWVYLFIKLLALSGFVSVFRFWGARKCHSTRKPLKKKCLESLMATKTASSMLSRNFYEDF
jgi:WD40 repeat protein